MTTAMTNGPSLAADQDIKLHDVKAELSDVDDDELYEDAGDLDMSRGEKAVWLVKLPSFVTERWSQIDDNEEIVLGMVKVNPNTNNVRASSLPPDWSPFCEPKEICLADLTYLIS